MKKIPNYFYDLPYDLILHIFSFMPRIRPRINKVIKIINLLMICDVTINI